MKKFSYEVRFHVKDNEITNPHWDEMTVSADCLSNAHYEFCVRIDEEFDYDIKDVDVIEIYSTTTGKLLKREEL